MADDKAHMFLNISAYKTIFRDEIICKNQRVSYPNNIKQILNNLKQTATIS